MNSRLEQLPNQKPILHVYYDPAARDWDERIRQALDNHGIKNRLGVLVIAIPVGFDREAGGG